MKEVREVKGVNEVSEVIASLEVIEVNEVIDISLAADSSADFSAFRTIVVNFERSDNFANLVNSFNFSNFFHILNSYVINNLRPLRVREHPATHGAQREVVFRPVT